MVTPGARFSKVPKLYGAFSGVTIPFLSPERRGFKSLNFTVILLFVTLKKCQNIGSPKQALDSLAFRARNVFGTLEKQAIIESFSKDNGDGNGNVTNLHI